MVILAAFKGPIKFRVTVKRSGSRSKACVTSLQMSAQIGEVVSREMADAGYIVDLHNYDMELLVHWTQNHAVVEIPITNRREESPLWDRPYLKGALQGPVKISMTHPLRVQFFVNSRTLMGCADPPSRFGSKLPTTHLC